jgi:1-acyl-sn-glycerol-3-phosphate acyltransferase
MKLLRVAFSLYAFLCFFVLMLFVVAACPFFLLFGKVRGGNLVYITCRYWAILWYFLIGVRYREIWESPEEKDAHYIFVANHRSYMDIPQTMLCMRGRKVRVLGKSEMVKYPLFGFIYKMAVIVVDRSTIKKRAQSIRALKAALAKGISIFIFPEGTFNETGKPLKDFYDGAFRIAIEMQIPVKPVIFLDTVKRMHYKSIFSITPGISRTVFLNEIPVSAYTMKDIRKLKQETFQAMENAIANDKL